MFLWKGSLGALCALSLAIGPAHADLTVVPIFGQEVYVDDNRRLRGIDGSGLGASITELAAEALYARPTYSISFDPVFRLRRHTSQKDFDFEDGILELGGSKSFERHRFDASGTYSRESSATTQVTDVGAIDRVVPQYTRSFNGSWAYLPSDRLTSTLFGGYTNVTFSKSAETRLVNYSYSNLGVDLRYAFSDRTTWIANSYVSLFKTPSFESETLSYAFQFGVEHALTETVDALLLVGEQLGISKVRSTQSFLALGPPPRIVSRRITQESRDSGQLITARVARAFDRGNASVEWNRIFSPSSLGSRQKREIVDAKGTYQLSRRWVAAVRIEYRDQEQEAATQRSIRPLRTYFASGALRYKLAEAMHVSLGYRFRHREQLDTGATGASHRITLEFRYRGEPWDRLSF